jgi:hypothetical protein
MAQRRSGNRAAQANSCWVWSLAARTLSSASFTSSRSMATAWWGPLVGVDAEQYFHVGCLLVVVMGTTGALLMEKVLSPLSSHTVAGALASRPIVTKPTREQQAPQEPARQSS